MGIAAGFADDPAVGGGDASRVEDVVCDLSIAFASGIAFHMPPANRVADRFHVVQLLAKAVDRMRAAGDARRRRRSWQFPVGQGPFSF